MEPAEARRLLRRNLRVVRRFGIYIATNAAVSEHIIMALGRQVLGRSSGLFRDEDIRKAGRRYLTVTIRPLGFGYKALVANAPMFATIVHHAHGVNPELLPRELIPSDKIVEAANVLHRARYVK